MEDILDRYEQDREQYWDVKLKELGAEAQQEWRQLQRATSMLVKGVEELADCDAMECFLEGVPAFAPWQDEIEPLELLDEHVCITFGWEAMSMLHSCRDRFWNLLELVKPLAPSDRSRAFLRRVARCYLFGFDAECIVMCRSALEREFEAVVSNCDCIDVLGMPAYRDSSGKPLFSLCARIHVAKNKNRITPTVLDLAHSVRKAGRDAVHKLPKVKRDAKELIADTIAVLDALADETHQ